MDTPTYKIKYKFKNNINYIIVKDESKNLSGSIKYRPAKYMIDKAYENKIIDKTTNIFEVTSGNMGIALATVAKEYGNPITIYMPSFMSEERKTMIKKLGARLILTKSFDDAFALAEADNSGYYVRQFENKYNPESYISFCHELENKIDSFPAFIAGVGTGGTLIGTGRYLKNKYDSKIIAIEPKESLILSTGINHGEHEIQGLSDGFIPDIYDKNIVDNIISISSSDAIAFAQKIKKQLNFGVGISSGANLLGAVLSNINNIITVFPDSDDRYFSTRLFKEKIDSDLVNQIDLISFEIL